MAHTSFLSLVRNSWHIPISGTKQYTICMKLKALKHPLKTLNKMAFSHISERAKKAQSEFVETQNLLLNNPNSNELKSKVKDYRKTGNFLLEAERQYL